MPMYSTECSRCGETSFVAEHPDNLDHPYVCPFCVTAMRYRFTPVSPDPMGEFMARNWPQPEEPPRWVNTLLDVALACFVAFAVGLGIFLLVRVVESRSLPWGLICLLLVAGLRVRVSWGRNGKDSETPEG